MSTTSRARWKSAHVHGFVLASGGKILAVEGEDLAALWVNWLREIFFLFAVEEKLVLGVKVVTISQTRVKANLELGLFKPEIHEIKNEIKAVTWHQAHVKEKDGAWEGTIILDV